MILYTIVLFGLAVTAGMFMIFMGLYYQRGSLVLGVSHAGIATLGLSLLLVYLFHNPRHNILYNDAALVFVMVFAGGLVLLALREGRKPPPMVVVGVHAAMALLALLLLVIGYMHS